MTDLVLIAALGAAVVFLVAVALDQVGAWLDRRDAAACGCTTCDQCREWEA